VAFAQTRPAKPDVELAAIEPNESADPNEPMVSVNFKNAEFKTIIRKLADWTGKTIIPSDEVLKQKVTMYAPQRLRRNEAVAVMRNALRAKGYVVEETAKIIYIRRVDRALPAGWSLDYDDGRRAGGARTWAGSMAADLARLRIRTDGKRENRTHPHRARIRPRTQAARPSDRETRQVPGQI
jgi:type II secretory pathway component GspD/PulD (secretin)